MTLRPVFMAALCGTLGLVLASLVLRPCYLLPLALWALAWALAMTARRPLP